MKYQLGLACQLMYCMVGCVIVVRDLGIRTILSIFSEPKYRGRNAFKMPKSLITTVHLMSMHAL